MVVLCDLLRCTCHTAAIVSSAALDYPIDCHQRQQELKTTPLQAQRAPQLIMLLPSFSTLKPSAPQPMPWQSKTSRKLSSNLFTMSVGGGAAGTVSRENLNENERSARIDEPSVARAFLPQIELSPPSFMLPIPYPPRDES